MEDIETVDAFQQIISSNTTVIAYFWAEWYEPSKSTGPLHEIVLAMSTKYSHTKFCRIEVETVPDVCQTYSISRVPSFVGFVRGTSVGTVEGSNPPDILQLVKKIIELEATPITSISSINSKEKDALNLRLDTLTKLSPCMVFMKGSPDAPKCGFSRQIIEILKNEKVPFSYFDILTDNAVREGLKIYSDWPTYPQVYVHGELVGGLDIIKEMSAAETPLNEALGLKDIGIKKADLNDRLSQLVRLGEVTLFMKGSPDAPKCGFSRTIVDILREQNIEFAHFDILTDEEVRAGLKTYSDWPTYPQLYVRGEFIGGLDIVKDMASQGSVQEQLQVCNSSTK